MGRESRFERQPNDWYPTDRRALAYLLPHLRPGTRFVEPCAGDGRLVTWLELEGHRCEGALDIAPRVRWVRQADALLITQLPKGVIIITNPPFDRPLLHAMIILFVGLAGSCWLLIDAPWAQTGQARPFLRQCTDIVAAGRMKMFEGTRDGGKKDHIWCRFTAAADGGPGHAGPAGGGPRFWALGELPA